jgi:hypothetical protein
MALRMSVPGAIEPPDGGGTTRAAGLHQVPIHTVWWLLVERVTTKDRLGESRQ